MAEAGPAVASGVCSGVHSGVATAVPAVGGSATGARASCDLSTERHVGRECDGAGWAICNAALWAMKPCGRGADCDFSHAVPASLRAKYDALKEGKRQAKQVIDWPAMVGGARQGILGLYI